MKVNETDDWQKNSASTRYNLPETCPLCKAHLKATYCYVGIFPYIHADFTLVCTDNTAHQFNFCMPYNRDTSVGYMIHDSSVVEKPKVDRVCPWHLTPLQVIRYYGDETFKDGTRKLQLRCPTCYYSERYKLT